MSSQRATKTSVANEALVELGSTTQLSSFDTETSNIARAARTLWDGTLRDLLAKHPWNFALRRARLNAAADTPAYGYARQFTLPSDCLRWLPDGGADAPLIEREGNMLLTNADAPLSCRYIRMVDDPGEWSPGFRRLFVLKYAESMAEGVTQSEGIKRDLFDRAEYEMKKAKRADGLETGQRQRGQVTARSSWLAARNRSYGWRG